MVQFYPQNGRKRYGTIAEVQTAEGKLYHYVAIGRTSKFAFVQLVKKTSRTSASAFLEALIAAVPYKIRTVLTDNGIQFTFLPRYADGPTARYITHMFDMRCRENGIEHRPTKVKHRWTNSQAERMNCTIIEATVKRYHNDHHEQFERHLTYFIDAYNYGRRLNTLKGLTLGLTRLQPRPFHPKKSPDAEEDFKKLF